MSLDGDGNLFVADSNNHLIRKITSAGEVTTIAGTPPSDPESPESGYAEGAALTAKFNIPAGLARIGDALYVADAFNFRIRKISFDGNGVATVSTVAGTGTAGADDGDGASATFGGPVGLVADSEGKLYVAEVWGNAIRHISFAGNGAATVSTLPLTGTPGLNAPSGLAIAKSGDLYIADSGNNQIRKVFLAPGLSTSIPADDAADVAPGSSIVLTFNTPMTLDTASDVNTRYIEISNDAEESVERIDIANPADGQLVFSNDNKTLTIIPATALIAENYYHIEIGSTALKDANNKHYLGISDRTSLNFDVTTISVANAPTIGTATPGNASASVAFSAPSNNGGSAITGYTATCTSSDGGASASADGTSSPITVSGLSNGKTYTCTVVATNAVGQSEASSATSSFSPALPAGAPVITTTATQATLTVLADKTGTGYFTLLPAGGNCGTGAQVKGGLNASGNPALAIGSMPLSNGQSSTYSLRNVLAGTAYELCFASDDGTTLQAIPTRSSITTAASAALGSNWSALPSPGKTTGSSKVASGADGSLYVSFEDEAADGKVTVKKYSNGAWQTLGDAGFSLTAPYAQVLALAPDGTPYVAYNDKDAPQKATVMKYVNGAWQVVGSADFSAGAAPEITLAFAPDGSPYVAYMDYGNAQKATVMKFNGTAWVTVGQAGFSAGMSSSTSLAFAPDGTPYLGYQDGGNSYKTAVQKFAGGSWQTVGNAGFSAGNVLPINIAFSPNGTLHAAYTDFANGIKATVMQYTAGFWVPLGSAGFTPGTAAQTRLSFAPDGSPWVVFVDGSNAGKSSVMRYSAGAWQNIGSAGFSSGGSSGNGLIFGADGAPYVVNRLSPSNDIGVYHLTSGPSVPTAPTGATATAGNASAAVAFTIPSNDGGASITGYTVTCSDGEDSFSNSGTSSPITVSGLSNGTAYTCTVKATNSAGDSAASTASDSVTPVAPPTPATPSTPSNPFNEAGTSTGNDIKDLPTGSGSGYVPATSSLVTNLANLENKVGVSDNGVVVITSTTREPVKIKQDAPDNVLFSVPVNNQVGINIGGKGINVVTNTDPVKDSSGKPVSTVLATKTLTNEQGQSVQSVQVVKGQAEVKSTEANQIVGGLTLSRDSTLRDVTATAGAIGSTVGFFKNPADFSGSVSAESGDAVVHVTLSGKAGDKFANTAAATRTLNLKAGEVARFDKMGELIGVFAGSLSGTAGKTGDALVTTAPAGIAGYPQAIAKLDGKSLDRLGNNLLPAFLAAVMPQGSVKSASAGRAVATAAADAEASFSLSQNATTGVVKLTFHGRDYYGLPLMPVPVDSSVANGRGLLADGTVVWSEQGVSVRFAPAVADLTSFAKTAQEAGMSTQIVDDGTIKLSTTGAVYFARPRFAADAANGTPGFAVNPPYAITYVGVDGQTYHDGPSIDRATFTGADGKSQIFDPALYDAAQIATLVQAAGSDWQFSRGIDGSLTLRYVGGQSFSLLPDYAVLLDGSGNTSPGTAPSVSVDANGKLLVRYHTGFLPMTQAFSVK